MRHSFALPILLHLYAAVVVTSYLKVSDQLACKTRSTLKYICPNIQLSAKSDENLDSLKVNLESLSEKEKERLQFIQKLNFEADEFAKKAGFDLSSDDDMVQRAVSDTDWSGTKDTTIIFTILLRS